MGGQGLLDLPALLSPSFLFSFLSPNRKIMTPIIDNWYNSVKKFHEAFGHPVSGPRGHVLPEPRRAQRATWLVEELMEICIDGNVMVGPTLGSPTVYGSIHDKVYYVKEMLDFLYFVFGTFVELGHVPSILETEVFVEDCGEPRVMLYRHRVKFAKRAAESVFDFMTSDRRSGQIDFMEDAARVILRAFRVMNTSPVGLFDVVHDSNMDKLWPDGNPRYNDLGKVIKPATWERPEGRIAEILTNRETMWLKENAEDDSIPF